MFKVYNDHKGSRVSFPTTNNPNEGYELACAAAELGHDALYRVFEQTDKSVTGEQFVIAYSVLGGKVTERCDATIPLTHW